MADVHIKCECPCLPRFLRRLGISRTYLNSRPEVSVSCSFVRTLGISPPPLDKPIGIQTRVPIPSAPLSGARPDQICSRVHLDVTTVTASRRRIVQSSGGGLTQTRHPKARRGEGCRFLIRPRPRPRAPSRGNLDINRRISIQQPDATPFRRARQQSFASL